jgi:deoxyribodipyrimidine photo-lyase
MSLTNVKSSSAVSEALSSRAEDPSPRLGRAYVGSGAQDVIELGVLFLYAWVVGECANGLSSFLAQSVFDVKTRLKALGSDLGVYFGHTESIVPLLVRQLESKGDKVEGVWLQREVGHPYPLFLRLDSDALMLQSASEEQAVEHRLTRALKETQTTLHLDAGARTLVHEADLPFKMPGQLPDVYTAFRKRVEGLNTNMVRAVLPDPSEGKWPHFPIVEWDTNDPPFELSPDVGESQLIEQLLQPLVDRPVPGDSDTSSLFYNNTKSAFPFRGGETAARERLDHYMGAGSSGAGAPAITYKDTRNGMIGPDYSTKFSPYLTFGCLSAREIAARCDELEDRLREADKLDDAARKNVYWIK